MRSSLLLDTRSVPFSPRTMQSRRTEFIPSPRRPRAVSIAIPRDAATSSRDRPSRPIAEGFRDRFTKADSLTLCVILERVSKDSLPPAEALSAAEGEESRILLCLAPRRESPLVSFRAAAAKNPGSFFCLAPRGEVPQTRARPSSPSVGQGTKFPQFKNPPRIYPLPRRARTRVDGASPIAKGEERSGILRFALE